MSNLKQTTITHAKPTYHSNWGDVWLTLGDSKERWTPKAEEWVVMPDGTTFRFRTRAKLVNDAYSDHGHTQTYKWTKWFLVLDLHGIEFLAPIESVEVIYE